METEQKAVTTTPWHRRTGMRVAIVLVIVFGAFIILLPEGLRYGANRWLLAHGIDDVVFDDVDFNPFTGKLGINGLSTRLGEDTLLHITVATVDVDWSPLFNKQVLLKEFTLANAKIVIIEDEAHHIRPGGVDTATEASDEPDIDTDTGEPWGMGLGGAHITNTNILYRVGELELEVQIDDAELSNLRTWTPENPARLKFSGQVNKSPLTLDIEITPFAEHGRGKGSLNVQALQIAPLTPLLQYPGENLRGELTADLSGEFDWTRSGAFGTDIKVDLAIEKYGFEDEVVKANDIAMGWQGDVYVNADGADKLGMRWDGQASISVGELLLIEQDQVLSIGSLATVASGTADLGAEEMIVSDKGSVTIGDVVWHANSIDMDLLRLSSLAAEGVVMAPDGSIQVAGLQLKGLDVGTRVTDGERQALLSLAGLTATQLAMTGEGNSIAAIKLQDLQTRLVRDTAGNLAAIDAFTTAVAGPDTPPEEDADAEAESVPLEIGSITLAGNNQLHVRDVSVKPPYGATISLDSFAANGLQVAADADVQLTGVELGGLKVVSASGKGDAGVLLSLAKLATGALRIAPDQHNLDSLVLTDLQATVELSKAGKMAELEAFTLALQGPPAAQEIPAAADSKPVPLRIGSIALAGKKNRIHFRDNTTDPVFTTSLRIDKFTLGEIDSAKAGKKAPLEFRGAINKHAAVRFDGGIAPLDEQPAVQLKGSIKALSMPPLSSYTRGMLGHVISTGQMDADIEIDIDAGKFRGDNRLKMRHLTVKAVDPGKGQEPPAMTLPLEQGLSMLRDSNDNIKLSIPISGTLDDPEFNFNDAIAQAIGKAMTMASLSYLKYTLQPFGTVLLVAELASDAGKAAMARLETVRFPPGSDELSDSARAYVDKLKTLLDERPQLSLTLCGVATGMDRQVLAGVGSKDKEATATAGKPATGVADKQPQTVVSDEALLDLARRRSAVVKGRFIAEHKIDASRLFNCHPQIDATADAAPGVTVSL